MRGLSLVYFDLPEGNVMAYYPEANILTGTACDPRSKTPNFKSIQVHITAA
jgi:anaerobic selenocysteine-containing dehydrogenase